MYVWLNIAGGISSSVPLCDTFISLPLQDYAADKTLLGSGWKDAKIYSDDWFGSNSNPEPDYVITTGRWAYTKVPAPSRWLLLVGDINLPDFSPPSTSADPHRG